MDKTFQQFLVGYRQRTGATDLQISWILDVSPITVKSWRLGTRSAPFADDYIFVLDQAEKDYSFDNKCVIRFYKRSGWTLEEIAKQFNKYPGWKKITWKDVVSWMNIGLPAGQFKSAWVRSKGPKPKTEADYIRKRFQEMSMEMFSLRHANNKGLWELEDEDQLNKRIGKRKKK